MNWDQIKGNWQQVKGQARSKWGKITEDDFAVINGERERLEGKIQERYGMAREEAHRQVDAWLDSLAENKRRASF